MKGLGELVAKIQGLENQSLWQKNPFNIIFLKPAQAYQPLKERFKS